MTNFTLADVCKVLVALVLFIPFAYSPGYVIGWIFGVLEFRRRNLREQSLIALVVSIATVPLLIYLSARFVSMSVTWVSIGAAFAMCAILFVRALGKESRPLAGCGRALLVGLGWIAIALASMVDFQWKDRLYMAASTLDDSVRNQIVESITRTGVRPWNPFFFPAHTVALRYHYFWFLPCSMVSTLGRGWVGPGHAIMAGTIWCGFSLMALVALYVRYFRRTSAEPSSRRAWTGVALLWVIGLDVIPFVLLLGMGVWMLTIDKWNEEIDGWLVSLIWAPHYVAGAIGALAGFLVLWRSAKSGIAGRVGAIAVAGMAFASLAGTAVYVALVFVVSVAAYGLIAVWKRWWYDAVAIAASGGMAALLALPYLLDLVHAGGTNSGPGSSFILPTVRLFTVPDGILDALHAGPNSVAVVNFLLLPLNYFLELGLLFIVGIVQARRLIRRKAPLGRKEWAEVALIVVPVIICTFFRSSVISNNDLGWRGFLIPQFVLSLWAIDYVRVARRRIQRRSERISAGMSLLREWVLISLWIGAAGGVAAFVVNRAFTPAFELRSYPTKTWLLPDQVAAPRVLALRKTYEWLDRSVPPAAIILRNPEFPDVAYGLYTKRQTVAADAGCGTAFGGSMEECRKVFPLVMPLFAVNASVNPSQIKTLCARYSAAFIVVKDIDPVWHNSNSWVWERRPIYSNGFSRVFGCSN